MKPSPLPSPLQSARTGAYTRPAPRRRRAIARVAGHGLAVVAVLLDRFGHRRLLLPALWFVRRRRQESEDVTGRWEALESEIDDEQARDATERMRRQAPEQTIVVEEQHADRLRPVAAEPEQAPARRGAAPRPQKGAFSPDETLSSQPSSISTKPTPSPRRISTSPTACTIRLPSSCRKHSRPRPIGAT